MLCSTVSRCRIYSQENNSRVNLVFVWEGRRIRCARTCGLVFLERIILENSFLQENKSASPSRPDCVHLPHKIHISVGFVFQENKSRAISLEANESRACKDYRKILT